MNDNRPVHVCWQGVHAVPKIDESDDVMRNTSIWPASAVHVMKNAFLLILNINEGNLTIILKNMFIKRITFPEPFASSCIKYNF